MINSILKGIVILFLVIIAVLEYIFVYISVAYGIILALILVLILIPIGIVGAVWRPKMSSHVSDALKAAGSVGLIPLYILVTSSIPWFFIDPKYLLPAVYSIILAIVGVYIIIHVAINQMKMQDLGLIKKNWLKYLVIGSLIGIPTGIWEYCILAPSPAFSTFQWQYLLKDIIYMLFFVALAEELLFRGIIQTNLQKTFGKWSGLILASALFAVMHLTWRIPMEIAFTLGQGLILGYIYNRTNSLVAPIFLHGVNNVMLVGILPYIIG